MSWLCSCDIIVCCSIIATILNDVMGVLALHHCLHYDVIHSPRLPMCGCRIPVSLWAITYTCRALLGLYCCWSVTENSLMCFCLLIDQWRSCSISCLGDKPWVVLHVFLIFNWYSFLLAILRGFLWQRKSECNERLKERFRYCCCCCLVVVVATVVVVAVVVVVLLQL